MMVGRLPSSAEAIGAVSLGHVLFLAVGIFGGGLLLGLDTLVSQAFGAGRVNECHRLLLNSVYLCLVQAVPYLHALNWSMLPLLLYFAFRRYLQAMNLVRPVMFALVTANLVNVVANWALIFGHLGAPAMGVEGSGWATCVSRAYMAAVLVAYALYHDRRYQTRLWHTPFAPHFARIRGLIRLGLPAALQLGLEIAVFAIVTALIGTLDPVSLAGHQIALNAVSLTYMVPLGISSAAAVRVGQALGAGRPRAADRAGWAALLMGAAFMSCAAAALLLAPVYIARIFTPDVTVIKMGAALLGVAAFFQLFDGLQIVATGALRGAGDTRTAMISHLLAYWFLGLPLGYLLCFRWGWGAVGLWIGLSLALITIGLVLLTAAPCPGRRFSPTTPDPPLVPASGEGYNLVKYS
jgi:MATE family multidrug resistance protein